jgi:DNA-binding response OmpR family regulator
MVGLDNEAARRIESILTEAGHTVDREPFRCGFPVCPNADVIFLWGDHRDYRRALAAISAHPDAPPVVLTTRLPDAYGWIDSLEAGVADYCVAPFDRRHVLWTLETALEKINARQSPAESRSREYGIPFPFPAIASDYAGKAT